MYKGKIICVVIPAYNEEKLIGRVIETMPEFVDKIVVVDDKSTDGTVSIVQKYVEKIGDRLVLIPRKVNQGVGASIVRGYKWARHYKMDITVVMAGDAQMDPEDMPALLDPIVRDEADYTKGNRLFSGRAWEMIPKLRYLGNSALSLLTKIASGYWHVADSQTGYTAITLDALHSVSLNHIYKRYGMPNDLLIQLNVANCRVKDVPIKPVYNVGEKSGIKIKKVIFTISWLLFKRFFWRLKEKYVIRDFHPLILFYLLSFLLLTLSLVLFLRMIGVWLISGAIPAINALSWMFSFSIGLQSMFFAMWFDMDYNKKLK